ncbi:glycosyltransferase family A protein [Patescibacteria group bacterium]
MRFSIIIPTLNEENYISRILESLQKQSFHNFDTVIVDNGSSDNTVNIINKLKYKCNFPIQLVHCKKIGISYARNFGVKYTKGKYIVFFDADGYVHKNWLKNASEYLEKNSKVKALMGFYIYYPARNMFKFLFYNSYLFIQVCYLLINKILIGRCIFIGNNMVIEKEAFQKAGMFTHRIHEDIIFSGKFFKTYPSRIASKYRFNQLICYSPRRFEKHGFVKTFLEWHKSMQNKESSSNYKVFR